MKSKRSQPSTRSKLKGHNKVNCHLRSPLHPTVLPIILSLLAVLSLCIGVAGIVAGSAKAKAKGKHTLMHYPAPVVWLRARLTAAKWVVWIGRLYLGAGMGLGTAAFLTALSQTASGDTLHDCEPIALAIVSTNWTGSTWIGTPTSGHAPRGHTGSCQWVIRDRDNVRWFSIRSAAINGLIGEGFSLQSARLMRAGLQIRALPGLGQRALIASADRPAGANPAILFESTHATTIIEMNGSTVDPSHFDRIVAAIVRSQTAKTEQNM